MGLVKSKRQTDSNEEIPRKRFRSEVFLHLKTKPRDLRRILDVIPKGVQGHPTSCSSLAEIMSVLFFHAMRYKVSEPKHPSNDRFILSKGHSAPILYAACAEAGLFPAADLLNLRKFGIDLDGHPTPHLNFMDIGWGSLGQGLSVACGMAYVGKYIDKASYRVYCLLGDSECAEGGVWEALSFASYYNLSNLCVIIDINRPGQTEPSRLQQDTLYYIKWLEEFDFFTLVVDGHNVEDISQAFHTASENQNTPTAILAETDTFESLIDIEDSENWHGKPIAAKAVDVVKHIETLWKDAGPSVEETENNDDPVVAELGNLRMNSLPSYSLGESVATSLAYGCALAKLGNGNERVIALDGDSGNSGTFPEEFRKAHPDQFIERFIGEKNMTGVAIGAACRDRCVVFASTFGAFFSRAFDQIRMGAMSQTNANFVGSYCGVSIGEEGPIQLTLEDLALFRTVPGSTVFYPSDAVSCEYAVQIAANTKGICFIRTSCLNTPVLYRGDVVFEIGKAKIVLHHPNDKILLIGAGVTLHEAMKASKILAERGVNCRVMDLFTVKPIDAESIQRHAIECGGKILTVEDHYPEGGIGEAVLSATAEEASIQVRKLAVHVIPRSGAPDVLMAFCGINSNCIMQEVIGFLGIN